MTLSDPYKLLAQTSQFFYSLYRLHFTVGKDRDFKFGKARLIVVSPSPLLTNPAERSVYGHVILNTWESSIIISETAEARVVKFCIQV